MFFFGTTDFCCYEDFFSVISASIWLEFRGRIRDSLFSSRLHMVLCGCPRTTTWLFGDCLGSEAQWGPLKPNWGIWVGLFRWGRGLRERRGPFLTILVKNHWQCSTHTSYRQLYMMFVPWKLCLGLGDSSSTYWLWDVGNQWVQFVL